MLTITVGFSRSGHKSIVNVVILLPANIINGNLSTGLRGGKTSKISSCISFTLYAISK